MKTAENVFRTFVCEKTDSEKWKDRRGKRSQRAMDRANEGNGCSEPVDVVKAGGIFIHDDSLKKQR